ncbi:sugar kinase [Actibacterium lipolyticum]|uniref:2-dehydro-3-deoxygluconokinase n=1 Tax=Actibacterium lipolyticum TaxID=1524263 RepID=A0A238KIF5_9RHOB|nr:sugar kinase [Actibacterium lipolyticum]SMX42490.1 2-dehydro-3-deoxygluconokinase [Actibacterium lipolyticum]
MNKRLVAVGECMVEMAPTAGENQFSMAFSGDTFNTVWYARKALGDSWSVDYVTAVGDDAVSRQMTQFMAQSGVGTDHIVRRPDATVGLYLIELEEGERHFSYWRGQSAARGLADDAAHLQNAFDGAQVVYFSGITLAILTPEARATFLNAVASARENGALVCFDPNLRPRLWANAADMCAAITQAAAHADIALPSFEDEAWHFGDSDLAATADRYQSAGVDLVVVKNGAGQMLVRQGSENSHHSPVQVTDVVDTTAAGDSFNAGFLSAFLDGAPVAEAVEKGSVLAGKVIQGHGALVDIGS